MPPFSDLRLTDADFRVLLSIVQFCQDKGQCSATSEMIGKAAGGKSQSEVETAIVNLRRTGHIATVEGPGVETGRTILLLTPGLSATPTDVVFDFNKMR